MGKFKYIPAVLVMGCRANCPNTRFYEPNEENETLGCIYKYGTLPQQGMPEWCPLPSDPEPKAADSS